MSRRPNEYTNANVDPYGVPPKKVKTKFKPGSLFIPAIFGGILLLLFWIKKCQ